MAHSLIHWTLRESEGKIDKIQLTHLPLLTSLSFIKFCMQSWSHCGMNIHHSASKIYVILITQNSTLAHNGIMWRIQVDFFCVCLWFPDVTSYLIHVFVLNLSLKSQSHVSMTSRCSVKFNNPIELHTRHIKASWSLSWKCSWPTNINMKKNASLFFKMLYYICFWSPWFSTVEANCDLLGCKENPFVTSDLSSY